MIMLTLARLLCNLNIFYIFYSHCNFFLLLYLPLLHQVQLSLWYMLPWWYELLHWIPKILQTGKNQ